MKNFSYIHNLPAHQHTELDFADVNIGRDNRLFVDPSRIHLAALAGNTWAKEADLLITSFLMPFTRRRPKRIPQLCVVC